MPGWRGPIRLESMTMSTPENVAPRRRIFGAGRVLITVYAILAIGATSRAVVQILTEYSLGPVPITASAVSAVIYILATVASCFRVVSGIEWRG